MILCLAEKHAKNDTNMKRLRCFCRNLRLIFRRGKLVKKVNVFMLIWADGLYCSMSKQSHVNDVNDILCL